MTAASLAGRPEDCLREGGELGALMRAHDWSRTPLGPVAAWPQSLRTAVSLCLASEFTMLVCWGAELTMLYNTAYIPVLGSKHPRALGRPLLEVFPEIEHMLRPMFGSVMATGKAVYADDLLFPLERNGYAEECDFTFCYSGIRDESGGVGGVLVTCTETTKRVVSERRLRVLRHIAERAASATVDEAWASATDVLREAPSDLPAFAVYRLDGADADARLWRNEGLAGAPGTLAQATLPDVVEVPPFVAGPWPEPITRVAYLPIDRAEGRPFGVIAAAVSPRRALDDDYRAFLRLVAEQVAAGVANASAREEERRRAEALAELDRAKTTFFNNISHEFRTPLTLQLGPLAEVLRDAKEPLTPRQRERLQIVERNSLRLLKLVNSLLDFSRIEAGRARANLQRTDVGKLTRDVASSFESAMRQAGLAYKIRVPDEPLVAMLDHDMWEKVVLNLVGNAFKFTLEGSVRVTVRDAGDAVDVSVEDTGCGIAPEHHARVFERFHRVEGQRSRTHEGTGIGLALVQDLVKLHGGRVALDSAPGRGSTFTVTLPKAPPAERVVPVVTAPRDATLERGFLVEATRWLPEARRTPAPASPGRAAAGRILLVDDNADMRDYVRGILEPHYDVVVASDGEEALALARSGRASLVLADVMMPRLDGLGLLRALRKHAATRHVPVILLSARAGDEEAARGLEAGADDYVTKPFAPAELLARVRAHLSLATERDAAAHRVREVLDQLPDAFFAFDRRWTVTYQNPRAIEVLRDATGGRFDDVRGRDYWACFPEVEGTSFGVMYRRAMDERVALHMEDHFAPFDRWYEAFAYPLSDGLAIYVRDITERKRESLAFEATKRALAESERLAALGGLVSGVAHEIRTPLTIIRTNATLLERRVEAATRTGDLRPLLDVLPATTLDIALAVDRANETVSQLKRFTRHETAPRRDERLDVIVREAIDVLRSAYRDRGGIVARLGPTPRVHADRTRIQQLVINLVENAVDATRPAASEIVVETSTRDDGWAVVRVADAGPGIAPDVRLRMYEPLYTTKPDGTGLGLSIVKKVVEDHGGTLACESRPGRTVFTAALPPSGGA